MELQSLHNLLQICDEIHKCPEIVATLFGFLELNIAAILCGSAETASGPITCPRKII